ncbi:hypothetical protein L3Q82_005171 [Scortum barcoo]|uniref:Uncharacterized protein n=1 Tax=Scortum barcoo TaxID=214431 RepID=A0ACB8V9R3_9TELE|nr:hypothetical protein L3Q82_005171 [Scortum barcoo]
MGDPTRGVMPLDNIAPRIIRAHKPLHHSDFIGYSNVFHDCIIGILYKGNGENIFISQQPPVISSIMGNGRRRSISCPSCNGQAEGNKLLAPLALACGADGSIFVGDFNYIRRIFPSGNVTSVMELSAVVIFLDEVVKVEWVVEAGIVLRDTFTPVYPLLNSSKKITVSNAPPFIKNDDLCKALSRRQVYMILKDADSHLNLTLNFKVDGFNYNVFVTSETMKCFGCGAEGHLIRACPEARREGETGRWLLGAASGGCRLLGRGPVEDAGSSGSATVVNEHDPFKTWRLKVQHLLSCTGDQGHVDALKSKKAAIANLLGNTAQGALVRSRFMNASMLDSPSKFFFSLESRNGQRKVIHCLHSDNGSSLTDATEIRRYATGFYRDLFKTESVEDPELDSTFLSDLPQVGDSSDSLLSADLTLDELHVALMSLANGKAPDIDGIPVDFYKAFWPVVGEDMLEVFQESFQEWTFTSEL